MLRGVAFSTIVSQVGVLVKSALASIFTQQEVSIAATRKKSSSDSLSVSPTASRDEKSRLPSLFTKDTTREFNARILAGDREAIFEGRVYYIIEDESVAGNADCDHFAIHVYVNPRSGRIVMTGNEMPSGGHVPPGAVPVVFRVYAPFSDPGLFSYGLLSPDALPRDIRQILRKKLLEWSRDMKFDPEFTREMGRILDGKDDNAVVVREFLRDRVAQVLSGRGLSRKIENSLKSLVGCRYARPPVKKDEAEVIDGRR